MAKAKEAMIEQEPAHGALWAEAWEFAYWDAKGLNGPPWDVKTCPECEGVGTYVRGRILSLKEFAELLKQEGGEAV